MKPRVLALSLSCLFVSSPVLAGVEIGELPLSKRDRARVFASRIARIETPAELDEAMKMFRPFKDGDLVLALTKSPHANLIMRGEAIDKYVAAIPDQVKASDFDRTTLEGFLDLANELGLYSLLETSERLLAIRSSALNDVLKGWYLSRMTAEQTDVLRGKARTGAVFLLLTEVSRRQKGPLRRLRACFDLL